MLAAAVAIGSRWARDTAAVATDREAAAFARSHAELLDSELQRFRLLPLVLAEYPDVPAALAGGDPGAARRLDATLELLAARTDAAVLYAIDARGRAVAASNWRLPTSFVGQDYAFRRYFTQAMARGRSELFALGSVSGRPGLYLARRIDRGGRALGIIVVKVDFTRLEREWARAPGATVVTDADGVILITSVARWRFHPTRDLSPARIAALRASRQFGVAPPTDLAFGAQGREVIVGRRRYRLAGTPAALEGGRLLHLQPLAPALAAARTRALLWGAGLLLLALLGAAALLRAGVQRRVHAVLEEEVSRRTAELRDANARLVIESEERAAADRRFRAAREELAQANRLGSLGQITAGVAHEINQPLAAIRTFAENGGTLLDRGAPEGARENLGRIVALTERIGAITGELRAFARKRTPSRGAPTLAEAIEGTLLLIGERARHVVEDRVPVGVRTLPVDADRIRLEQILVNLLQNALDAVAGMDAPRVTIDAEREGGRVTVRIADNGTGVDASLADTLFTPFASAKPEGLGLGLAIARDIAREFGGELDLAHTSDAGAAFVLTLRLA
ncbi:ATP-binding protein [Sphingomonas sp. CLY1604]|uniref:ATP-binding protein n=1 Tax=Sphingomonas sp. CLY1604 TaxID=3457786 RepID=UPI003FD76465